MKKLSAERAVVMVEGARHALPQLRMRLNVIVSFPCVTETFYFESEIKLGVFRGKEGNEARTEILPCVGIVFRAPVFEPSRRVDAEFRG